jgi:hypothetical protein
MFLGYLVSTVLYELILICAMLMLYMLTVIRLFYVSLFSIDQINLRVY